MTTTTENLSKAWILALEPSILVRITKEKWFSRCFLSLKLFLSCPSLDHFQNGYCSPFMSRVLCSNRSGPRIFVAASKLKILLPLFDFEVHRYYEIFSCCNEGGLHCNKIEPRCSKHSPPWFISLHPNWFFFFFFSAPFVHFQIFHNLNEKYIKLT